MSKRSSIMIALLLLLVFSAACGSTGSTATTPTPTDSSPSSTPTQVPFSVTNLATTVSPSSFDGIACGSATSFTFSTVITVTGGGGQVTYTWNIGSSHIPGSVSFAPGETSKTVTYTLKETNIQPATAASLTGSLSVTSNGKTLTSTPASVVGICTFSGTFQVVSLTITVSPGSVTGLACNTIVSFVYTATVTIAPNSNGGNVILSWSFANSRAVLTFGPYQPGAQLTQTVTYTLTGKILRDNFFPPAASISSTSPNALTSAAVKPFGPCYPTR